MASAETSTEIKPYYKNVYQGTIEYGGPDDILGTFGASGGCVIVAAINPDKSYMLAHIDAITSHIIELIPATSKVIMSIHPNNEHLLKILKDKCPSSQIELKPGSSMMVHNSIVTMEIGPPIDVDISVLDKKIDELLKLAEASSVSYEKNMKGVTRPPAPGMNFWWNSNVLKWEKY
jgi:hypothetical protein